jgi:hypothetical protein
MMEFLKNLGLLRSALLGTVVLLIAIGPFAGGHIQFAGWALMTTLLGPVFYVVAVFLLPLDMVMTRVFMSDKTGAARQRFKRILWLELALLVALLLSWAPFVMTLLEARG